MTKTTVPAIVPIARVHRFLRAAGCHNRKLPLGADRIAIVYRIDAWHSFMVINPHYNSTYSLQERKRRQEVVIEILLAAGITAEKWMENEVKVNYSQPSKGE